MTTGIIGSYVAPSRGYAQVGPGRPPSIVTLAQRALAENAVNIPTYFSVLHDVAIGEFEAPVRQRVEAAVYLLNRHLGTPTSVVDIKTVSEARLSADDLLEIAQLVRSMPRLLADKGDSPPEAQPAICDADNTPHSEKTQI